MTHPRRKIAIAIGQAKEKIKLYFYLNRNNCPRWDYPALSCFFAFASLNQKREGSYPKTHREQLRPLAVLRTLIGSGVAFAYGNKKRGEI